MSFTPSISIGASSMSAINSTSASGFRTSTFGQKPLFGEFKSSSFAQLNPFGSTFSKMGLTVVSQPFSAICTSACGSTLTPTFSTTTPTFSAMNTVGIGPPSNLAAFGGNSTPTFGSTAPPFVSRTSLSRKSTSRQKSSVRGFGSPNPTQSSSSGSPFGATSTSVFGSTSVPAFGSKTSSFSVMNMTALNTPSISVSKPSSLHPSEFFFNRCASCPRNTSCQTEPAFTFGAAIHPASSVTSIPESGIMTASFGATNVLAFGAPSTSTSKASSMCSFKFCSSPDFGASATTVGAIPTTIFAISPPTSTCQTEPTQPFVTSIQPASIPAFGTTTTSFDATNVPTVCTPSTSISEASSMPSFEFCSTPAFDLSAATFGATAPTFRCNASPFGSRGSKLGTQSTTSTFITKAFGQIPSGNLRGSGLTSYKATNEPDNWQTQGKLISISAMPEFKDQSHEELRWADYQLGNKGDDLRTERIKFSGLTIGK